MNPEREQAQNKRRCVLTMHEVRSIKDLIFVVGRNSESGAQKAIFEILDNAVREPSHKQPPADVLADLKRFIWLKSFPLFDAPVIARQVLTYALERCGTSEGAAAFKKEVDELQQQEMKKP